jgi:uncharacterized membrane protein
MMHLAGYPFHSKWIMWSVTLYVLAGACWLPVVWLQMRLRDWRYRSGPAASSMGLYALPKARLAE